MADRTPAPDTSELFFVIPAKAGIQIETAANWTPACAGVTRGGYDG